MNDLNNTNINYTNININSITIINIIIIIIIIIIFFFISPLSKPYLPYIHPNQQMQQISETNKKLITPPPLLHHPATPCKYSVKQMEHSLGKLSSLQPRRTKVSISRAPAMTLQRHIDKALEVPRKREILPWFERESAHTMELLHMNHMRL